MPLAYSRLFYVLPSWTSGMVFATHPMLSFHFRWPLILSELASALINAWNSRLVLRQSQTLEMLLSSGSTSKDLKHLLFCAPRDSHADAHNCRSLSEADAIVLGVWFSWFHHCRILLQFILHLFPTGTMQEETCYWHYVNGTWSIRLYLTDIPAEMAQGCKITNCWTVL